MSVPAGGYKVILADPPWAYQWVDRGTPTNHYETQGLDWLCAIPVAELASDDAALFLWVRTPGVADGDHIKVCKAWGFEPVTLGFVWVKSFRNGAPYMGLGYSTRSGSEICILGKRGSPRRQSDSVRQVIEAPVGRHSSKPGIQYDRIEALYAGPYCELFARHRRPGWDAFGDEAFGDGVLEIVDGKWRRTSRAPTGQLDFLDESGGVA